MSPEWFIRAVHRSGRVILDTETLHVDLALFDSGAVGAAYISEHFVNKHFSALEPYIEKARGRARLATDDHEVPITRSLILPVEFADPNGTINGARLRLFVLPNSHNDMVIELPAIVAYFDLFFLDMIKIAMEEYAGQHSISATFGHLTNPWSLPSQAEAPEDIETPLPCSFTDALHYMEMPYEDAVKEFISLIDEHVAPGFRQATDIVNMLNVFVPSNCEGVKGLPPIELTWKEECQNASSPRHVLSTHAYLLLRNESLTG